MSGPRVIVVAKRTSYQRFVEEEGDPRARRLVQEKAPAVRSWLDSHAEHQRTLDVVMSELSRAGAQALLLRRAHAAFDPEGAELVIAVDISSAPEGNPSGDPLQILLQTFAIMGKSINTWELRDADVVVRPALRGMSSGDFAGKRRAIDAGRAAMQAALPQLRAALEAKAHAP